MSCRRSRTALALRRAALLASLLPGALLVAGPTRAEPVAILPPVVGATERRSAEPLSGLGLSGYDPVSYQVEDTPRAGLARHELVWAGLAWRFASAANRAAFLRQPDAFLPRLGGYDAAAAALGRLASADPLVFVVSAGRLYLFRTPEGRQRFLARPDGAAAAEAGWLGLRPALAGS